MEQGLALLDETWDAIVWITDDFKDGVKTVNMGEEDFELLEAHQLLVQGFCANRYMATFKDRILGWKDSLNNVGDVRQLISDIQQLWRYLEPLFIGSEEVRRELPEDSERFASADKEVRQILADMVKTKNIRVSCDKEGLIKQSENVLAQIERCKKALDDFLARKRAQFPRFYFVSDPDLLDILSNGNVP